MKNATPGRSWSSQYRRSRNMTTKRLLPMLERSRGPITFGMFLRAARTSMDLTQAEMARRLAIARGTLCDIEKGRQLVSTALAAKVARKAGLSEALAISACLQDQITKARLHFTVTL